ncbi:Mitochondrial distribution and morphology protein 10 [Exophiala xenobiotica]|uniref:Mitochondrial distribution and morphology protein 10 n=1 Tax=Lithohypha guttulata TaxID=1690604 RepID=A0ABR0KBW0_9EURO|nr:Mitochondrial distribution and morphology protein 10 [Lithohypha guttulata]KAK5319791.1 Mitochondrial distribution and morphology protein 10 [Exophiala xenobiotica]
MLPFMDYVIREFGTATDWNYDNSYSFLTATSDAILAFETPSSATLHVSSLSTANFATSYTLSTLGQLDGSLSYLYSSVPLGHVPSQSPTIPLKRIVEGYRDVPLPVRLGEVARALHNLEEGRKPTLLHATLALPPPTALTALYARRIRPETLLSVCLNSTSITTPATPGLPPASLLAHVQHDTGRFSIEGLASTDNALLGARALWNFAMGQPDLEYTTMGALSELGGNPDIPIPPEMIDGLSRYYRRLLSKPSLLSAGAEVYYSPFSHVIGLSTGLRFTTLASHITPTDSTKVGSKPLAGTSAALTSALLAPANVSHSSFPYTMTLTLNPIIGALASTYSVKPTSNLALSSRFDFNVYSWESQYTLGAEIWRGRGRKNKSKKIDVKEDGTVLVSDELAWVRDRTKDWFSEEERLLKDERMDREQENVIKLRLDAGCNIGALWTGRIKSLLVSAGVTVSPVAASTGMMRRDAGAMLDAEGRRKGWTGKIGLSVAYST